MEGIIKVKKVFENFRTFLRSRSTNTAPTFHTCLQVVIMSKEDKYVVFPSYFYHYLSYSFILCKFIELCCAFLIYALYSSSI